MHSESIQIDSKLVPIIAGQKRVNFESIMRDTRTIIYQPCSLVVQPLRLGQSHSENENDTYSSTIYITGNMTDTKRAKDAILALIEEKVSLKESLELTLPRA